MWNPTDSSASAGIGGAGPLKGLQNVLDLGSLDSLAAVGITEADLRSDDLTACQAVVGAVAWLGHDGLLVPSARAEGNNLVIYPISQDPEALMEILGREHVG